MRRFFLGALVVGALVVGALLGALGGFAVAPFVLGGLRQPVVPVQAPENVTVFVNCCCPTAPAPSATPVPTATPGPWLTPVPTATPGPWLTPVPTATPGPWLTPVPTATPTSVPGPEPTRCLPEQSRGHGHGSCPQKPPGPPPGRR